MASDRYKTRSIPIAIHASFAMLGYTILALAPVLNLPHILRYLCLFPISAGFFSAVTLVIAWQMNNQQSEEGRGTGMAMLNVIGQLGPMLGTGLYPDTDAPFYSKGHAVCAGFMALVVVLAMVLRLVFKRANRRLANEARYARLDEDGGSLGDSARNTRNRFEFLL